jgi:hypothetical protein
MVDTGISNLRQTGFEGLHIGFAAASKTDQLSVEDFVVWIRLKI